MNILFIIASDGFQDFEFNIPRKTLEESGFKIDIASSKRGECKGKLGKINVNSNFTLNEIKQENYIGVVFIGGIGAWNEFYKNQDYLNIAHEFYENGKIIGAICIAPTILSDSGIFINKKVTGWDQNDEQKNYIQNNGGIFTGNDVEVDGNIITANGPNAAEEFGKILQKKFKQKLK